jgi:hypothetical protein
MKALVTILPALLCLGLAAGAAENANFSGTWHLNVEKSRWGSKPKPVSVTLVIEHSDPKLHYRGTVTQSGENTRDFTFDGAIDGKEYPMTSAAGAGMATLRRVDANTIETDFRSTDGTRTENARTSLSRDGKVLTRTIREKTPETGSKTWVEIYERR